MKLKIGEILRELRKQKGISQESLAEYMNLSVQAISKWECGQSYPDITFLPILAEYYQVSIDYLLIGKSGLTVPKFPDDDVLRVVQFRGGEVLRQDNFDVKKQIPLTIDSETKREIHIEIWGSAVIKGDVGGYVEAGGGVNCGNVGGYVEAGSGINCGNVGGYVEAGGGVHCGNVEGYVEAGGGIDCGNVDGYVEVNGDLHCQAIQGDVNCRGNIYYET